VLQVTVVSTGSAKKEEEGKAHGGAFSRSVLGLSISFDYFLVILP